MDDAWTRNFEAEVDVVAPLLAKDGGVAAALYIWLHSRVYACNNNIRISMEMLAGKLGVSRRALWNAARALEGQGIIMFEARRGNGGGTVFHLTSLSKFKCEDYCPLNMKNGAHYKASNGNSPAQQIGSVDPITKITDFNLDPDLQELRYDSMISLLDRIDKEVP